VPNLPDADEIPGTPAHAGLTPPSPQCRASPSIRDSRADIPPNINLLRAFAALPAWVDHGIELAPGPSFPTEGVPLTFRIGGVGADHFVVITLSAVSWQFFEKPVIQSLR